MENWPDLSRFLLQVVIKVIERKTVDSVFIWLSADFVIIPLTAFAFYFFTPK